MPTYEPSKAVLERIENNFRHHTPHGDQTRRYEHIRGVAREFAGELVRNCPDSRELALALTHLEQVVFFANAAVARNETDERQESPA